MISPSATELVFHSYSCGVERQQYSNSNLSFRHGEPFLYNMRRVRRTFKPATFLCTHSGCRKACKTSGGLKQHTATAHPIPLTRAGPANDRHNSSSPPQSPPPSPLPFNENRQSRSPSPLQAEPRIRYHPILDGTPCNIDGNDLPPNTPPPPLREHPPDDFSPFDSRAEFEFAEFLYKDEEMSGGKIDRLAHILAALYPGLDPPCADHNDLYLTIDAIIPGDIPWQSFTVTYDGDIPPTADKTASWKRANYEVWYRDPLLIMEQQLGNPDFAKEFDIAPKQVFDDSNKRQYSDLMSGNWAWQQAVSEFTP